MDDFYGILAHDGSYKGRDSFRRKSFWQAVQFRKKTVLCLVVYPSWARVSMVGVYQP